MLIIRRRRRIRLRVVTRRWHICRLRPIYRAGRNIGNAGRWLSGICHARGCSNGLSGNHQIYTTIELSSGGSCIGSYGLIHSKAARFDVGGLYTLLDQEVPYR